MPKPRVLRNGTQLKGPRQAERNGELHFQYSSGNAEDPRITEIRRKRAELFVSLHESLKNRRTSYLSYKKQIDSYKSNLNVNTKQVVMTRKKLARINEIRRRHVFRPIEYVRFENLGKVLSALANPELLNGRELMVSNLIEFDPTRTVEETILIFYERALEKTIMGNNSMKYNCRLIIDPKYTGKDDNYTRGINNWYNIRSDKQHNPILGVQVMDPDPKVLLEFTKGMLRRTKDPIVVLDLYGDVFFP